MKRANQYTIFNLTICIQNFDEGFAKAMIKGFFFKVWSSFGKDPGLKRCRTGAKSHCVQLSSECLWVSCPKMSSFVWWWLGWRKMMRCKWIWFVNLWLVDQLVGWSLDCFCLLPRKASVPGVWKPKLAWYCKWSKLMAQLTSIGWVVPPPSKCGKWRFIGIPS